MKKIILAIFFFVFIANYFFCQIKFSCWFDGGLEAKIKGDYDGFLSFDANWLLYPFLIGIIRI